MKTETISRIPLKQLEDMEEKLREIVRPETATEQEFRDWMIRLMNMLAGYIAKSINKLDEHEGKIDLVGQGSIMFCEMHDMEKKKIAKLEERIASIEEQLNDLKREREEKKP